MVLHGVSHDVGHFDETSVVLLFEGMEDTALYGFETVFDGGDGAVADDVRSVLEKVKID